MEIRLASLLEGARQAEGAAVIIDVYRAFTTAAVAFLRGAEKIVLVAEIEQALALRDQGRGDLCVGEVGGRRPEAFDYNNSPYELSRADLYGKTLILSTRAGAVGVEAAQRAGAIYGGSLAVAGATVRALLRLNPGVVTLVAMGREGRERTDEDELCALYMRNLLHGLSPDPEAVRSLVLSARESQKFDDPEKPHFHPRDRDLALRINSAPFAIKIARENGLLVARPERV